MIASPAAIIAGIVASASVMTELSPFLKWTLALIAGGGAATIVQGVTVVLRTKSSALTAGMGSGIVSSLELAGAIITARLAIVVPMLCIALIVFLCIFVIWKAGRFFVGRMRKG